MKKQHLAYIGLSLMTAFLPETMSAAPDGEASQPAPSPAAKCVLHPGLGEIINAEIGFVKPEFSDENELDVSPYGADNTAWAQITVSLEPGRDLSRFDFLLERTSPDKDTEQYFCLAVAPDDQPYSMKKSAWVVKENASAASGKKGKVSGGMTLRMLFPLPLKVNGTEIFSPSGAPPLKLKMRTLKTLLNPRGNMAFRLLPAGRAFTPAASVPPEGIYGKDFPPENTPAASSAPGAS